MSPWCLRPLKMFHSSGRWFLGSHSPNWCGQRRSVLCAGFLLVTPSTSQAARIGFPRWCLGGRGLASLRVALKPDSRIPLGRYAPGRRRHEPCTDSTNRPGKGWSHGNCARYQYGLRGRGSWRPEGLTARCVITMESLPPEKRRPGFKLGSGSGGQRWPRTPGAAGGLRVVVHRTGEDKKGESGSHFKIGERGGKIRYTHPSSSMPLKWNSMASCIFYRLSWLTRLIHPGRSESIRNISPGLFNHYRDCSCHLGFSLGLRQNLENKALGRLLSILRRFVSPCRGGLEFPGLRIRSPCQ